MEDLLANMSQAGLGVTTPRSEGFPCSFWVEVSQWWVTIEVRWEAGQMC